MLSNDRQHTLDGLQEKAARRLTRYKRRIKCAFHHSTGHALPVFVMGYGRSGTTMLLNTFALDERFEICGENDSRIAKDYMLIYESLTREIALCKTKVLMAKPILNSFEASAILERYDDAKIIWMLRDYRDVSASAVKRFGSTVGDYLKELVRNGGGNNWLASGMPQGSLDILREMDTDAFTDHDWMGLVWWSVNRTILRDRLPEHKRFCLLKYENLVTNPERVLEQLYEFLGLEYRRCLGRFIHDMSVGKGSSVRFDRTVKTMCDNLTFELSTLCHVVP